MVGNVRHLFPGGNTSKGFYSFYKFILNQNEARRIICIKGGPGTGKSSLMKKVGTYFNEKGYDVEYHHCSSDNNSLDGVVIKPLNVALLDGTSPHVVDPINPGAVDEILNLGTCWKETGFKQHKNAIMHTNKEIGETFKRAYRYLGAARLIHNDWSNYNQTAINFSNLNKYTEVLKNKLLTEPISNLGYDRHLFATAFTPNGIITYIEGLAKNYEKTYVLTGDPGTGKTNILKYLYTEAVKRGFYVEVFHHPLIPKKIEHILIPKLSLAFLSDNELNTNIFNGTKVYMQTFQNSNMLNKNEKDMKESMDVFYSLLNKGLNIISHAKALHDQMEKYYIDNMDFSKMDTVTDNIINKILQYEKDFSEE